MKKVIATYFIDGYAQPWYILEGSEILIPIVDRDSVLYWMSLNEVENYLPIDKIEKVNQIAGELIERFVSERGF